MSSADDLDRPDPPRATSLRIFQFNFNVSLADRIAARGGAPAFAMRRSRLDRAMERFWSNLEQRRLDLWIAAGEGRIDEDGREVRQALLDADGRDTFAEREHKRLLFKAGLALEGEQRLAFNRAWARQIEVSGLEEVEAQCAGYEKWFPIEANLPVDPQTGRYLWMGEAWEPIVAPTREDILARFPMA